MSKALACNFKSSNELLRAVKSVSKAGIQKFDVFTPYPLHGLDEHMKIRSSHIPWIALFFGLLGAGLGYALQWWTLGIDFPINIGGKPYVTWPAYIPVTFEMGVLICALATFVSIFVFCGLPKFSSPLETDEFAKASTDDEFLLYVESKDSKFNESELRKIFEACHGHEVRWIGGGTHA